MSFRASVPAKNAQLAAVVRRADGTVENLGVIAYYDRNPLKRLAFKIRPLRRFVVDG